MSNPWLDIYLPEEVMNYLWDIIDPNNPSSHFSDRNALKSLAGNISKSAFVKDKDDFFYESILKECAEHMYCKDWDNYYDIHFTKARSVETFEMNELWVNYQKQHEFNPPHKHDGMYSFVVFMKIPTHWKEQHALPLSVDSISPCASDFQFLLGQGSGLVQTVSIPLSPEDEGRMLFFPAWLLHQVFPFYGTEEERITLSGNIGITECKVSLKDKEVHLAELERQVESAKELLKYERNEY